MPKFHPKNDYKIRKLRKVVVMLELRIRAHVKKGQDPPVELLDRYSKILQEIETAESLPERTEIEEIQQALSAFDHRIKVLEGSRGARAAFSSDR